jgi:phage terminase Nu1 subunit (DNA packaging protein)
MAKAKPKLKRGSDENLFSISGASDALQRSRRTITKAMKGIKPDAIRSGLSLWRMATFIEMVNTRTQAPLTVTDARAGAKAGNGDGRLDLSSERAKLAVEQTAAIKMKNAIASGEYVAVKGAGDNIDAFIFRPMREIILCIPGKCSSAVALHSELDREAVFEILTRECRQALTLMSMIGGIVDQAKNAGASQPEDKNGDPATGPST